MYQKFAGRSDAGFGSIVSSRFLSIVVLGCCVSSVAQADFSGGAWYRFSSDCNYMNGLASHYAGSCGDDKGSGHNTVVAKEADRTGLTYISGGIGVGSSGNTVKVKHSKLPSTDVNGGIWNEKSKSDTVVISDSSVGSVYGGRASQEVSHNKVVISNKSTAGRGRVAGGSVGKGGKAKNNEVLVRNSHVEKYTNVIGGFGQSGELSGNKVTIEGNSTIETLIMGALNYDNDGTAGSVSNNTVVISGGTLLGGAIGGMSENGEVSGNIAKITGGTVHVVLGGGSVDEKGEVRNNKVIVKGAPNLSDAVLYGGFSPRRDQSSGNILEIYSQNIQVQNILAVQEYHFFLPATIKNNDVVLIVDPHGKNYKKQIEYLDEYATDRHIDPYVTNLQNAKVGVALQSGAGQVLQKGDRVALIRNANGVKTAGIEQTQLTGYQGIALQYDFTLENDNGRNLDKDKNNTTLWAVLADDTEKTTKEKPAENPQEKPKDTEQSEKAGEPDGADSDPDAAPIVDGSQNQQPETPVVQVQNQSKAPVEGRLGMLALLQQGATLVNQGIDQALYAAQSGEMRLFLAVDGNHSRYDTGSHMRLNGVNFMLGLTQQLVYDASAATLGAFIEAGEGSYTTYNTFDMGRVRGSGNSHYYGGGVLGRYDWLQGELAGLYAQGALHVGHTRGDWHSGDMFNSDGNVRYQTAGTYYAAHAGVGYKLDLNADWSLDLYDKYYLTYVGGDSATLSGDRFHFKAMHSSLNQLGARLSSDLTQNWTGYVGAAWEREFNGTARASVYGLSTASPSLKGDSGMFEVGVKTREASTSPIHLGVALEGHTGVHRGLGLNVQASYRF